MRRYQRHTSDTAQSDIVHRATKVQRMRRGRGWVAAHTNHFHPLNCSLLPLRNCHQSFFNANTDFRLLLCRTPLMSHPNAHGPDPWAKPPGSAAENTSDDWFQRGVGVSGALGGWVCMKASSLTACCRDCGLLFPTIHQPPPGLLQTRRFCNMSLCWNDHGENLNPQCLLAPTIRSSRCWAAGEDDYRPAW